MRNLKANALSLIVGLVFLFGAPSVYSQLVSSTGETLVNTTTTDSTQQNCAVAMDTSGRYVVVWESEYEDGDGFGIFAKVYNEDHTVRVPDFEITTTSDDRVNDQRFPDVAMTAEGIWCVTWQSQEDQGWNVSWGEFLTQGWDVYRRVYTIDGAAVSSRSRVNSSTTGNQMHPAIAAGDDRFVITWTSEVAGQNESEIEERYFLTNGANLAATSVVHISTGNHLTHSDVAMSASGEYVFTWQADGLDGDRKGIYMAVHDASYALVLGPTLVNTTTAGNQQEPRVAMDENGDFMIVWSSFDQDGDHFGIYGQRYTNGGVVNGGEIAITTNTTGSQDHAAIAVSREGGKYVISWTDDDADGDKTGVYSRTMYANGSFLANDVLINTTTSDFQNFSDVAIGNDTTQAVYAWQSGINHGATGQADPSYYGIYSEGFVIEDITPPVANCQNITVYLDGTGNVTITAVDIDGGSTDNIGIVSMVVGTTAFDCSDIGLNTSSLTVYDAEGLSDNCVAAVIVEDTISPTAICQNITVYLDGAGTAIWSASDLDGGSTDNCASLTLTADMTSATCTEVGANTVTLTVTDDSGNSNTCTSTVTVMDTVSPSAVCQNITSYLDATGNITITGSDLDGGSTDNCSGSLAFGADITAFTCAELGVNTVIMTVTDPGGNTSSCTSIVTILDTISPTIVCQDITLYLDGSGNVSIAPTDIDGGSFDNCSLILSISTIGFTCSNTGTNSVTLTATDPSGNNNTCTSTVTVLDTISPTAVCQDITVYLDGTGSATIVAADIDGGSSDNCGVALTADISSFTCADTGANSVELTVIDPSGNTGTCTSTVTLLDTISPTVVCQDITVYLDGTGNATIAAADVDGGSSDNCGAPAMSIDLSAFDCSDTGVNTVTLTGTDATGNMSTCTSTVTVLDTISPTVVCQDITVYLDGTGNVSIIATDVDGGSTDNCGAPTLGIDVTAFTCSNTGANTVTLTGADASGNDNTCTSTVTVLDTISPTVVCQDITVYLDGTGNVSITATDVDGGTSDNCGALTMSIDLSAFDCSMTGANTVTLTGTDASGNDNTCTATVTVLDTISPTVVCQDITVYLDGTGNATIAATDVDGGSSDNCGAPTMSIDLSGFDCSMTGANTVILTGTDASGNDNTCTATVTVLDTISPTIICQDITVYLDGTGNATIAASDVDGGSTDNCGAPTLGIDVTVFTCSNTGANTVTLTGTDASGNTNMCVATVTVMDTLSPTAVCQNINVYLDGVGNASIVAADVDGGSTDNCGTPTLGIDLSAFTCADLGANSVTLTVTDGNTNSTSCIATVTVLDTISPVADVSSLGDVNGLCEISTLIEPTASDNCSAVTVSNDATLPITANSIITWTYTDANGNVSTQTQNAILTDLVPPTASNPADSTYECFGDAVIDVAVVTDEADNCTSAIAVTHVSDVVTGNGCQDTITRTYNVADGSGNSIDVVQMIYIEDVTAPTASNPLDLNVQCLGEVPAPVTGWVTDEADNCGAPVVAWVSDVSDGLSCPETITRTFTVSDNCGNSVDVYQMIVVMDVDAPLFDVASLTGLVGFCDITPPTATATDNCNGVIDGVSDVIFPINTLGTTIVTWTFTDGCGNVSTQTQDVTINAIDVSTTMASDNITIVSNNTTTGVTYQWIDCNTGQNLPGETNHNYTPTYGSDFAVIITQDGCSDTSACVPSTVGLDPLANDSGLEIIVFPNPSTNGNFSIQLNGEWNGEVKIELVDTRGRLVYSETTIDKLVEVKLERLLTGTYFVNAKDEQGNILTTRLVTVND
jgi:hypothetical protein